MAQTLAAIQTKIAETEAAITRVKTALAYGKGDRSVTRVGLKELTDELAMLRRDEAALAATAAGATNGAIMTASWS